MKCKDKKLETEGGEKICYHYLQSQQRQVQQQ